MIGPYIGVRPHVSSGASYDPDAQAWFDEAEAQGTPIPDAEKVHYNNFFLNVKGLGSKGSADAFTPLLAFKGLSGYYDTSNKWPLLSCLRYPTNPIMVEKNGGGSYVQQGTNPNFYVRQSVASKCWSTKVIPSTIGITLEDCFFISVRGVNRAGTTSSLYDLGMGDGATEVSMFVEFTGTQGAFAVNDGTYITRSFLTGNNKGMFTMIRSSGPVVKAIQNGTQLGSDGAVAAVSLGTKEIMNGGFSTNNGGTVFQTGNGQDYLLGIAVGKWSDYSTAMLQQLQDSLEQYYIDMGISSPF